MSEKPKRHPLETYAQNDQVTYISILASICYSDKEFSNREKDQLDELLENLNIRDEGKAKIYSSVFNLQHEDKLANLKRRFT